MEGGVRRSQRRRAETLIKKLAKLLDIPVQVTASATGKRLEQHCTSRCKRLGFQVIDDSSKFLPHDIRVNGFRVQCKNRSKHGKNGNGVNLFKNSQKRYRVEDVDFFVIRYLRKCYVIPSSQISDSDGLVFGYVNLNVMRHYIDAWSQLAGDRVPVDVQTNLFQKVQA